MATTVATHAPNSIKHVNAPIATLRRWAAMGITSLLPSGSPRTPLPSYSLVFSPTSRAN